MPVQMAQYGTKHSHAAGKVIAMQANRDVELVGVFEPDTERRAQLANSNTCFATVHWFESAQEMLADPAILAVASEGLNIESLDQTEEIVAAGKHVWYDKAPGDNWAQLQRVVAAAREKNLLIQIGYMLRYHDGFHRIAQWANEWPPRPCLRNPRPDVHQQPRSPPPANQRPSRRHLLRACRPHARSGHLDPWQAQQDLPAFCAQMITVQASASKGSPTTRWAFSSSTGP